MPSSKANLERSISEKRRKRFSRLAFYFEVADRRNRAAYGQYLIKTISQTIHSELGTVFSVRQLESNRQFYRTFPNTNALCTQLNWTHYRTLIHIGNTDKKEFYLAETEITARLGPWLERVGL